MEAVGSPSLEDAKQALLRALKQLVDRNGENYVSRSALKVFIKRLLPSFDEQALGCSNFSEFLHRFPELVIEVDAISGGHNIIIITDRRQPHAHLQSASR